MQVVRTGERKLFDAKRRQVFLEWFAATANIGLSAEQAGVNYKTTLRHRMNDELFREAWDRALEQGVARQKAKLLETKSRAVRIGIEGDLDAPEMEDPDPQIVLAMLRESERRLAGYPKRGAPPRVASNAEVRAALVKALKAYRKRAEARRGSEGGSGPQDGSQGPLHHPSPKATDGPPPRPGEDL